MEFWRFKTVADTAVAETYGTYNYFLVALSFLIAACAGYAVLEVADRMRETDRPRWKRIWLAAGATSVGCGIWAMHFVGMLAFSLPVPISYELLTTALSVVPAFGAGAVVLIFLDRVRPTVVSLNIAGLVLALGIAGMHFTGMEAMRMDATMIYDPLRFGLSVVAAHVLAVCTLSVKFFVGGNTLLTVIARKIASGLLFGSSVAGMHYTAMSAARYYYGANMEPATLEFSPGYMSLTIAVLTALILGTLIASSRVSKKMSALEQSLEQSRRLFQSAIDVTSDAFIAYDTSGAILSWNHAAEATFGWETDEVLGRSVHHALFPDIDEENLFERGVRMPDEALLEVVGRRRDGKSLPIELSIAPVHLKSVDGYVAIMRDITVRKQEEERLREAKRRAEFAEEQLAKRVEELEEALGHVQGLRETIPICMHCHKVRNENIADQKDDEFWEKIDTYIEKKLGVEVSHGLCDECLISQYPEMND